MEPIYMTVLGSLVLIVAAWGTALYGGRWWPWATLIGALTCVVGAVYVNDEAQQTEVELVAAQRELLALSQQLDEFTQGTGSYGYFAPTVSSVRNAAIGSLIAVGDNPLYDVRARIMPDPYERSGLGAADYELLDQMIRVERWIDIGTLNPGAIQDQATPWLNERFELGAGATRRAFNIFFSSRNDQFVQFLRFMKLGERWFVAYRVESQGRGDNVLHETIQEGYPRNDAGEVEWHWTAGGP